MEIPQEYVNREQSYLKHRVLKEYLTQWGHKLGSLSRKGPIRIWYVDCFAGPWMSRGEELKDTSIYIGLQALEDAAATWGKQGYLVRLGAIFVEKNSGAFKRLQSYLEGRAGVVETFPLHGQFGEKIDDIAARIGSDPAFIFVDPTGFKGVAMRYIARLAAKRMRDVLVNVMFNHINRFKDDPRRFLRDQMREFFGLGDEVLSPGLNEVELLALYRANLKESCKLQFAADLAIPHPSKERTWFYLVVGGNHPQVLRLFREVESKVVGREAASIRNRAKERVREESSGQLSLGLATSLIHDRWYERQNRRDHHAAISTICARLATRGACRFDVLWPELLEDLHITHGELSRRVRQAHEAGILLLHPAPAPRSRSIPDETMISVAPISLERGS